MVSHSPPDVEGRFYDALIHDQNDAWNQVRYMCYASAKRYINNAPEREDVIQTAVIKIWRNIKSYDFKKPFKTWLNTIVRRTAIDALRKKYGYRGNLPREHGLDDLAGLEIRDSGPTPMELILRKENYSERFKRIRISRALSEKKKEVIELHYMQGKTLEDIARIQNRPVGTVKSSLNSALETLRKGETQAV